MRNAKGCNLYPENLLHESRRSSYKRSKSEDNPDPVFNLVVKETKWNDEQLPSILPAFQNSSWALSQSMSCPDFFQRLAAGKVSPFEAEHLPSALVSPPKCPVSGVRLRHRFCPWDGTEFRPADKHCPQCGSQRTRSRYTGKQDHLETLLLPPWERVLWKPQPYEDNYVPRSFLESLARTREPPSPIPKFSPAIYPPPSSCSA
jgi:hypothetical protein